MWAYFRKADKCLSAIGGVRHEGLPAETALIGPS